MTPQEQERLLRLRGIRQARKAYLKVLGEAGLGHTGIERVIVGIEMLERERIAWEVADDQPKE